MCQNVHEKLSHCTFLYPSDYTNQAWILMLITSTWEYINILSSSYSNKQAPLCRTGRRVHIFKKLYFCLQRLQRHGLQTRTFSKHGILFSVNCREIGWFKFVQIRNMWNLPLDDISEFNTVSTKKAKTFIGVKYKELAWHKHYIHIEK